MKAIRTAASMQLIQFWHDRQPPEWVEESSRKWSNANPDYDYIRFDFESAQAYIQVTYGDALAQAFSDINISALAADIFRVAYLLGEGGTWVDMASECQVPLREWIPSNKNLVLLQKPWMIDTDYYCNGFIYSKSPKNPLLQLVWQKMSANLNARAGECVWSSYGAGLFYECIKELKRKLPADWDHDHSYIATDSLTSKFRFSSSSRFIPKDNHWERRQKRESLFIAR